jgi:4a-hydroxytetrahydrobiopterin dehydratase
MNLSDKKCIPCHDPSIKPLSHDEATKLLENISTWKLAKDNTHISKEFSFNDFVVAMKFVNHIADIAEEDGHHPDIHIHYDKVLVELWTHSIGGLHQNDFIIAAKIDKLKKS